VKVLSYIFLFLFVNTSFAQNNQVDTTWFDSDWKEISKKYASFYRTVKKSGTAFQVSDYYLNGNLQMVAEANQLSPLVKNGTCTYYNKNQTKSSSGIYKDGKQLGAWIYYYDNQKDSSLLTVLENGEKQYIRKSKLEDVYTVVEVMPEFPGGTAEMVKFIQTHVKYPKQARKKGWTGKTFLKFIIDPSGNVIDPIIIKSSGYSILDDEALRVVSEMPKWAPGTQNNKPVSVFFNLPLNFALNN
jgi:TonB family protein